jgi:hypothetical protein
MRIKSGNFIIQRKYNAITDPTIQSLAAHVWHGNPELVRVLIEVG